MNIFKQIFSIKNDDISACKIITILGITFKTYSKKLSEKKSDFYDLPRGLSRPAPKTSISIIPKKLIAISGSWLSGSSTVCDMLSEFNNIMSFSHRKIYSGLANQKNHVNCEIKFFHDNFSVFKLIEVYGEDNEILQDNAIKRFMALVYRFYDENKDIPIYQEKFLDINIKFLQSILDLDDYTKAYMQDKRYPTVLSSERDSYEKCSFVCDYPNHPYIFYKFKKMSIMEFDVLVAAYLYNLFNNISDANAIILDQILSTKLSLDIINFYMSENPMREIFVYRDPRDEFVNLWREKFDKFCDTPAQFIRRYKNNCVKKLQTYSTNRLCIRFEDMVFDYDKTVDKILKFLDMDENEHIYKKQIFIPEKSMVNVGEYKEFHEQSIIKEIEKALPEYLYERQG